MAHSDEFDELIQEVDALRDEASDRSSGESGSRSGSFELAPEEIGRVAIHDELFVSTTEHRIDVYVPNERRDEVSVGQYVVIPLDYRDELIFGFIEKLAYRKRDELDDMSEVHVLIGADDVGEADYIQLARVAPITQIRANRTPSEVRHVPKPNALVRQVTERDEVLIGLDIPDNGLFMGFVAVNGEPITFGPEIKVPYYLVNDAAKTGDPILFTHALVAGMSGRGKTHVAKNFLRQIVGSEYALERRGGEVRKPAMVIIDPENEYWQLRDDPSTGRSPGDDAREELLGVGGKYGGVGNRLTVFAASESGTSYRGCDAFTEFTIPFTLVRDFPYLIAGGELNEAQYAALERLVRDFFNSTDDPRYAAFERFLDDESQMAPYLDSGVVHEATLGAIKRRVLRQSFRNVFDQGGNALLDLVEDAFAEDRVSVFATDHLSAEAERVVVLAVMSMVADAKTKSLAQDWARRIARLPVVLAVDEAHNYLTQAETQQERIIVGKFISAAKQGRKNRLGLTLITQNPQDVHEGVLSQISTRILLGMDEAMAEHAGAPKHFQKALPYFERGRMVVASPDNSHPVELQGLPFCVVRH